MDPGVANKYSAFCHILVTTLKGIEMLAAPGGMLIFGGDVSALGLASFVVTVPMLATSLKPPVTSRRVWSSFCAWIDTERAFTAVRLRRSKWRCRLSGDMANQMSSSISRNLYCSRKRYSPLLITANSSWWYCMTTSCSRCKMKSGMVIFFFWFRLSSFTLWWMDSGLLFVYQAVGCPPRPAHRLVEASMDFLTTSAKFFLNHSGKIVLAAELVSDISSVSHFSMQDSSFRSKSSSSVESAKPIW